MLHLFGYRQHEEDFAVPLVITQEGIARAVWIDVRHVVQYVRPLMEEEFVRERMAHIEGGRRRRKVYCLTDRGKSRALQLQKSLASETVRVRDAEGVREETVAEVLQRPGVETSVLEVIREFVHSGAVDVTALQAPSPGRYVEMLADAPKVSEFLGRERELETLMREGDGPRIFVIKGVAGIGKSTLAARVCGLRRSRQNVFWHRIRSWDTPHSILAALGTFLSALGRPGLKTVLAEGRPEMAPEVLREDLPGVKAVIVIDDAHDASRDVLEFLRFLKDAIAETPGVTALVITRRSLPFYDRRDVVLDEMVQEVDLEGLEPEVVEATTSAEERGSLPIDLLRHPLFLKLMRASTGRRARREALRDFHRFIQEAIYSELPEPGRRMMKIASLYRVPIPPEALLFEATLSRDVMHDLMERALLTVVGEEDVEVHDTIRDFFEALLTEVEKTEFRAFVVPQLRELASKAWDQGDLSYCISCLSNALHLSPSGSEGLAVYEALGDVKERIGDVEGGLESYRMAMVAAGDPEYSARLYRKIGTALVIRGEIPPAAKAVEDGFQALGQRVCAELGWLNLTRCRVLEWLERWEEAKEHGIVALETFEAFGELSGQAQAYLLLGHIETGMPGGRPSLAQRYFKRALDLAEALGDAAAVATVHLFLSSLYAFPLGNVEKAEDHLTAVSPLVDDLGDTFKRINFLSMKGAFDLHIRADFEGAEALFEEAASLGRKLRSPGRAAFAEYLLGWSNYYQGRFGKAMDMFREFADDMRERGIQPSAVEALCMAAECALLEGNVDEFRRILVALRDQSLSQGAEARPMMMKVVGAIDLFLRGDLEASRTSLEEAVVADEGGLAFDPALPHVVHAALSRALGREEEATEHLKAAASAFEALSRTAHLNLLETREQCLAETLHSTATGSSDPPTPAGRGS